MSDAIANYCSDPYYQSPAYKRKLEAARLAGPGEDDHYIGAHEGETCGRYPELDEDAPRGYRPRPCGGLMMAEDGEIICERCGAMA